MMEEGWTIELPMVGKCGKTGFILDCGGCSSNSDNREKDVGLLQSKGRVSTSTHKLSGPVRAAKAKELETEHENQEVQGTPVPEDHMSLISDGRKSADVGSDTYQDELSGVTSFLSCATMNLNSNGQPDSGDVSSQTLYTQEAGLKRVKHISIGDLPLQPMGLSLSGSGMRLYVGVGTIEKQVAEPPKANKQNQRITKPKKLKATTRGKKATGTAKSDTMMDASTSTDCLIVPEISKRVPEVRGEERIVMTSEKATASTRAMHDEFGYHEFARPKAPLMKDALGETSGMNYQMPRGEERRNANQSTEFSRPGYLKQYRRDRSVSDERNSGSTHAFYEEKERGVKQPRLVEPDYRYVYASDERSNWEQKSRLYNKDREPRFCSLQERRVVGNFFSKNSEDEGEKYRNKNDNTYNPDHEREYRERVNEKRKRNECLSERRSGRSFEGERVRRKEKEYMEPYREKNYRKSFEAVRKYDNSSDKPKDSFMDTERPSKRVKTCRGTERHSEFEPMECSKKYNDNDRRRYKEVDRSHRDESPDRMSFCESDYEDSSSDREDSDVEYLGSEPVKKEKPTSRRTDPSEHSSKRPVEVKKEPSSPKKGHPSEPNLSDESGSSPLGLNSLDTITLSEIIESTTNLQNDMRQAYKEVKHLTKCFSGVAKERNNNSSSEDQSPDSKRVFKDNVCVIM